jgi:hypothetical protein
LTFAAASGNLKYRRFSKLDVVEMAFRPTFWTTSTSIWCAYTCHRFFLLPPRVLQNLLRSIPPILKSENESVLHLAGKESFQNSIQEHLSLPPPVSFPNVSIGNPDVNSKGDRTVLCEVWIPRQNAWRAGRLRRTCTPKCGVSVRRRAGMTSVRRGVFL